jgi:hypothetical protein
MIHTQILSPSRSFHGHVLFNWPEYEENGSYTIPDLTSISKTGGV